MSQNPNMKPKLTAQENIFATVCAGVWLDCYVSWMGVKLTKKERAKIIKEYVRSRGYSPHLQPTDEKRAALRQGFKGGVPRDFKP